MRAIVVYESIWGNTAAIARAIAAGIGPEARALSTAEATGAAIAGADLVVTGAPVLGFNLPTERMRNSIRVNPGNCPTHPDLSHPSLRSWLEALPQGHGRGVAFETRLRGPFPGGATGGIMRALERAGYAATTKPASFFVTGKYGPLREGELERAREWGATLHGEAKAL